MYVRRVTINHVRSISHLEWLVEPGKEAGWHVIIGDNGSGKSSFLRSIAIALVGEKDAEALRQDWDTWLSRRSNHGDVEVQLIADPEWDVANSRGTSGSPGWGTLTNTWPSSPTEGMPLAPPELDNGYIAGIRLVRFKGAVMIEGTPWNPPMRPGYGGSTGGGAASLGGSTGSGTSFDSGASGTGTSSSGWFSAAYGPFRRFTGGTESEKIFSARPRLAAHLSVFGEDFALTESIRWLQDLQFRKLENAYAADLNLIDQVTQFVNQPGFLPHHTQLHEISSAGVRFRDGNGYDIRVEDLSDGYRSMLSMAFELLRQLSLAYPPERLFHANEPGRVQAPGVVLIDEIDAHLHPTWQKRVGKWLHEHFPKIQFIVTTHSPLICQAASEGSVWRLPRPGTNEVGGRVEGTDLERLVYGNVLDAYGTDLFGEDVSRSDESKRMLQRLAVLNRKERLGKLSNAEREEQLHLRTVLPTAADTLKTAEEIAA